MRIRCIQPGRIAGIAYRMGEDVTLPDKQARDACTSGRFIQIPDDALPLAIEPEPAPQPEPRPAETETVSETDNKQVRVVIRRPQMKLFHLNRATATGERVIIFTFRAADHYSDSSDARFRNIRAALNHYKSMFDVMIVVEHDKTPQLLIDDPQIDHLFIRDDGPFRKAQALNVGWRWAVQKYGVNGVCFCDADIVVSGRAVRNAYSALKKSVAVNPYSTIVHMNEKQTVDFVESGSFAKASKIKPGKFKVVFAGGIVFVRVEVLRRIGGWDERFVGWGGEDNAFGNVINYLYPDGKKTLKETALHLCHSEANAEAKPAHVNYRANMLLNRQSKDDPRTYWQSLKHRAQPEPLFPKSAKKILILGSGPTAPLAQGLDLSEWYVIAINNAWRLGCWDANIYPMDFHKYPGSGDAYGKDIVDHHIYRHVNRKWGDHKKDCGYTMAMDAAYYALTLEPEVIAFLGTDMTYTPDKDGNTHFYGKGGPDPLRLGVENLQRFVATFAKRAKEHGVRLYNFSPESQESLLTYERYDTTKDIDLI